MAANVFEGLGIIEARHIEAERLSRAARLWGVAETLFKACGSMYGLEESEQEIAAVRDQLGEEVFSTAWKEGGEMTFDQAIAYAMGEVEE